MRSSGRVADSCYLIGALVTTFSVSVIAFAEAGGAARLLNVAFGAWIIIAPFVFDGSSEADLWNGALTGIALIALSLRRGNVRGRYGTWDRWV